ncbi:MAG: hypothetical protein M0P71_00685 [Melioribacteraceae bacterium]|nr:hypothetical protein [Melioribacteraceae bacterium]
MAELTGKLKEQIDNMGYENMLSLWRFAPAGHPMFQGDVGEYYSKVMAEKRIKVGNDAHVAASKSIGWK